MKHIGMIYVEIDHTMAFIQDHSDTRRIKCEKKHENVNRSADKRTKLTINSWSGQFLAFVIHFPRDLCGVIDDISLARSTQAEAHLETMPRYVIKDPKKQGENVPEFRHGMHLIEYSWVNSRALLWVDLKVIHNTNTLTHAKIFQWQRIKIGVLLGYIIVAHIA